MADDSRGRHFTVKAILDGLASIAAIATSLVLIAALGATDEVREPSSAGGEIDSVIPEEPIGLDGAVLKGNPNAQVIVIEYVDFECPFCGRFAREILPDVLDRYVDTGKVLWAFHHLPLLRLHPSAVRAAEAAECAGRQDRFWQMHDLLFADARREPQSLVQMANSLGLNAQTFQSCLAGEATDVIKEAVQHASELGIKGTPTFLFGRIGERGTVHIARRESGIVPPGVFRAILDQLLRETADTGG